MIYSVDWLIDLLKYTFWTKFSPSVCPLLVETRFSSVFLLPWPQKTCRHRKKPPGRHWIAREDGHLIWCWHCDGAAPRNIRAYGVSSSSVITSAQEKSFVEIKRRSVRINQRKSSREKKGNEKLLQMQLSSTSNIGMTGKSKFQPTVLKSDFFPKFYAREEEFHVEFKW